MQQILIRKSAPDIEHQFRFLWSLENAYYYRDHRKALTILAGVTLAFLCLMFFTNSETLVTLKAVSSILFILIWVGSLAYALWIFVRVWNRYNWIKKIINEKQREEKDYYLSFDDQKLIVRAPDMKLELEWTFFKAYLENQVAIFLFPEGSLYSAYSFSPNEIGEQNLLELKEIAKRKLTPLETRSV